MNSNYPNVHFFTHYTEIITEARKEVIGLLKNTEKHVKHIFFNNLTESSFVTTNTKIHINKFFMRYFA
ncbi:hypothetical protein TUM3792_43580 [Shewanella sp. MBTL60-007]|nr:hypothetical protein TUM3792_43580 [Shewanella sp. MBTL60-007]